MNDNGQGKGTTEAAGEAFDRIRTALRGLRFGTVTAVVQDGIVIQVERTEKIRLERRAGGISRESPPPDPRRRTDEPHRHENPEATESVAHLVTTYATRP